MNDNEPEEAIAHIRRSTAVPIQRFLDAVMEYPLEDPPPPEGNPAPAAREGARRERLDGPWRRRVESVMGRFRMPWRAPAANAVPSREEGR